DHVLGAARPGHRAHRRREATRPADRPTGGPRQARFDEVRSSEPPRPAGSGGRPDDGRRAGRALCQAAAMSDPTMVGDLRIDGVLDGEARFAPEQTFRGTTPEMWQAHENLLDEEGKLHFTM